MRIRSVVTPPVWTRSTSGKPAPDCALAERARESSETTVPSVPTVINDDVPGVVAANAAKLVVVAEPVGRIPIDDDALAVVVWNINRFDSVALLRSPRMR